MAQNVGNTVKGDRPWTPISDGGSESGEGGHSISTGIISEPPPPAQKSAGGIPSATLVGLGSTNAAISPTAIKEFSEPNTIGLYHGPAHVSGPRPSFGSWNGPSVGSLGNDTQERIRKLYQASLNVFGGDEVRARLAVSQAILESGVGLNSGLARKNNFFGIKGVGTAGSDTFSTREFAGGWRTENAGFAINNTAEDSVLQYKHTLGNSRYAAVMQASTFGQAAHAVRAGGYATDPDYAAKLERIHNTIVAPLIAGQSQAVASNGRGSLKSVDMSSTQPVGSKPQEVTISLGGLGAKGTNVGNPFPTPTPFPMDGIST